jgi:PAS domain S-box-containing protein
MNTKSNFEIIRQEIAVKLHLVATILAIPVAIVSGYRIFIMDIKPHFILDVLIAIILVISYYYRSKIEYNKLMLFLLGYVLILGTVTLLTFGLFGFGFMTMFFSVVITTTLFGIRYGLAATGLAVIITVLIILGVHFQWIYFDTDFNFLAYSIYHWIVQGIAFTCILLMTVLTHGSIYSRFEEVNKNLAESDSRFNLALETVDEAVWELGLKNNKTFVSNKTFVNNKFFEIMHFASKDLSTNLESWKNQIHYKDLPMVEDVINKHIEGSLTNIDIEYRIKDISGGYHWISTRGKIVERDSNGNPSRVIGTHRDIGPRKHMENLIKESEEKYRNLFMNANDAILLVANGYIIDSNLSSADLFGLGRDELIGKKIIHLCPLYQTGGGESRSRLDTLFRELIKNGSLKVEWEFKRSDDKVVETSMGLNVISGFENPVFQLIITDISELKRFEEAKLNAIVEAEERERLKLAGNLHDDVGPLLSSLNMYLSLLGRNQSVNVVDYIPEMQGILKEAISSIREISNNFSPHNLKHFGLIPALNQFLESFGNLIDIRFNQNIENTRFPTIVEISCFRIIKELINNSLKHSKATIVTLEIFHENKKLQIAYHDNGTGFDLEKTISSQHKGMGLLNILNRLTAIKANYEMNSIPGEGFKFKMNIIVNGKQ